jgi:hypothetical protein
MLRRRLRKNNTFAHGHGTNSRIKISLKTVNYCRTFLKVSYLYFVALYRKNDT